MDYKIEKKEAFRILGISTPLHVDIEQNFESAPKFLSPLLRTVSFRDLPD